MSVIWNRYIPVLELALTRPLSCARVERITPRDRPGAILPPVLVMCTDYQSLPVFHDRRGDIVPLERLVIEGAIVPELEGGEDNLTGLGEC